MWIALFSVLFIFLIIGLIAVIGIYSWQKEKERTQALQLTAGQLGWSFAASVPLNMIAGLERIALFNQGHSKELKILCTARLAGLRPRSLTMFMSPATASTVRRITNQSSTWNRVT